MKSRNTQVLKVESTEGDIELRVPLFVPRNFDLDFENGLDVLKSNDSLGFENLNDSEVNCGRFLYCKNCKDGCEECDPILANRKRGKRKRVAKKEIETGQTITQNLDVDEEDEEKDKIEVDSEKELCLNFKNSQTVIDPKNLDGQSNNEAKDMINVDSSQGKNGCGSLDRILSGQKKRKEKKKCESKRHNKKKRKPKKDALKEHELLECSLCGKSFLKEVSRTEHLHVAHKKEKEKCPSCEEGFSSKPFLMKQIDKCFYCDTNFNRKTNPQKSLAKHMKHVHRIRNEK